MDLEPQSNDQSNAAQNQQDIGFFPVKRVVAILFFGALVSVSIFLFSSQFFEKWTGESVMPPENPPRVDNTLIMKEIEDLQKEKVTEDDPYGKAERLFELASMQLLYRSVDGSMQRDAIRNLEEAYLLIQNDRSVAGKELTDKINLTRLVQFASLIFPFQDFDLTKYEINLNGSVSRDDVSVPYALALMYMIDFSDHYFYSDDDKAVRSIGVYLKAVALDYFSDTLNDQYKETLRNELATSLLNAGEWKNLILAERPLVTRVMAEAYELYAVSVFDKNEGSVSRDYPSEVERLLNMVDSITSDPIQRATVKLSVLRVAVQSYENIGEDPASLHEKAEDLSKVSPESEIIFGIFFGTSPELVNLPKATPL